MVAPNGATRTKANHPSTADGLHAHVRGAEGRHVLDAGPYAERLAELARSVPAMQVQITTAAVGRHSPAGQRRLVERLLPDLVSIALREIIAEPDHSFTRQFSAVCTQADIAVQDVLYVPADVDLFGQFVNSGFIPNSSLQVMRVLGR